MKTHPIARLLLGLLLTGCSSSSAGTTNVDTQTPEITQSADDASGPEDSTDTTVSDTAPIADSSPVDTVPQKDSTPTDISAPTVGAISTPQAPGDAMAINTTLFSGVLTLAVSVKHATAVTANVDGEYLEGTYNAESSQWTIPLDTSKLAAKVHDMEITAKGLKDSSTSKAIKLHVRTHSIEFTNYETVGAATTPYLHSFGDELWVTWVQPNESPRRVQAAQINGAGKRLDNDQLYLTPKDEDVPYGRVAAGSNGAFGVLYQVKDSPWTNRIRVMDSEAKELVAPLTLDAEKESTTADGDIAFDGEAFVATYRNYTSEQSTVYWVRANPETGQIKGPIPITTSGNGKPKGAFTLPSYVRIAAVPEHSLITFTRDLYDGLLDMMIPRAYAVIVDGNGNAVTEDVLPQPLSLPFGYEAHANAVHGELVPLWTLTSLNDTELNAPHRIFGARVPSPDTKPSAYKAVQMVKQPRARAEMVLVDHPHHYGVMAWTDQRAKDGGDDIIKIYATAVDYDLATHKEILIKQSRVFAFGANVGGVPLGSNTLLVWLDERKGGTVVAPKSEVYFETLWL